MNFIPQGHNQVFPKYYVVLFCIHYTLVHSILQYCIAARRIVFLTKDMNSEDGEDGEDEQLLRRQAKQETLVEAIKD